MEIIFKQIKIDRLYRIYAEFKDNSGKIILLGDDISKCTISSEELDKWCKLLKMSSDEYFQKLLEYLQNPDEGILFSLDGNEFTIFKKLKAGKLKFFSCNLEKVNYVEHIDDIFDRLYTENMNLKKRLPYLEQQNEILEKDKKEYEAKLKEFVEKAKQENDILLGNFVQVLNEKKRKIQDLQELLEAKSSRVEDVESPIPRKRNKKQAKPEISDTEDSDASENSSNFDIDNYDTDEEKNTRKNDNDHDDFDINEDIDVGPSTSKNTYDLLLGDDDDNTKTKSIGIRKRSENLKRKTDSDVQNAPPKINIKDSRGCSCNIEIEDELLSQESTKEELTSVQINDTQDLLLDYL